jgi:hypothetical protein
LTKEDQVGRKYYHPKRKHYRPSGAKGLLLTLATAWLSSRGGHHHHRSYHRPSLKSSLLSFLFRRLTRSFK